MERVVEVGVRDDGQDRAKDLIAHKDFVVKLDVCNQGRRNVTLLAVKVAAKGNGTALAVVDHVHDAVHVAGGDHAGIVLALLGIGTEPLVDDLAEGLDKGVHLVGRYHDVVDGNADLTAVVELAETNAVGNHFQVSIGQHNSRSFQKKKKKKGRVSGGVLLSGLMSLSFFTYDLPPSSRVTPAKCSAAAFMTILPTIDEPV